MRCPSCALNLPMLISFRHEWVYPPHNTDTDNDCPASYKPAAIFSAPGVGSLVAKVFALTCKLSLLPCEGPAGPDVPCLEVGGAERWQSFCTPCHARFFAQQLLLSLEVLRGIAEIGKNEGEAREARDARDAREKGRPR